MQSERTNTDVFLMKHLKYLRIFVVYLDMERKTFKALRKIDDESCKMLNMMVVCVFLSTCCCTIPPLGGALISMLK